MNYLSSKFSEENNINKNLEVSLDKKYRFLRKDIEQIFSDKQFNTLITKNTKRANLIINEIISASKQENYFEISSAIEDLIHMSLNRFFKSKPRKHEFVLYYLLNSHYRSMTSRLKTKVNAD